MKAKLSMAFEDLRGSDGNVTARGSRSGLTLVKKTRPRTSDSVASLDVRGNMDDMGATFRTLDQAGKDSWDRYGASTQKTNAVNGTTYSSTGYAAFVALNGVLLRTSDTATAILVPPAGAFVAPSIGLSLTIQRSQVTVVGDASTPAGVLLEVRSAPLANITNKLPKGGYVSVGFFALTSDNHNTAIVQQTAGSSAFQYRWVSGVDGRTTRWRSLGKTTLALSVSEGGLVGATGEAPAPLAKAPRMRKAA